MVEGRGKGVARGSLIGCRDVGRRWPRNRNPVYRQKFWFLGFFFLFFFVSREMKCDETSDWSFRRRWPVVTLLSASDFTVFLRRH